MSSIKHAVITAAGLGSRLGMNTPKCLVEVAGRSIISRQLDLLQDVEDVRVVVGFQRSEVIEHVRALRSDVVFVCNHQYANTSVLHSLFLGCHGIRDSLLALDGDVIPEASTFEKFKRLCVAGSPFTAICKATSTDPVYAEVDPLRDDGTTTLRSLYRDPRSEWEWPGISFLPSAMVQDQNTFVYQQVEKFLPMQAALLNCWEVDTPEDLARTEKALRIGKF